MKLQRRSAKRGRIEIIPMIDAILILLVFYMSFSTFSAKEKRIDSQLPVINSNVASTQVSLDIVLHVRNRDEVLVNGARYDTASLRDAMRQLASIGQEATVVIEADPTTDYQAVIGALDACALANLKKVAFRPLPDKVAAAR
ncbi:MAG TPA: biopolymer transporter ExbD [Verrucomicrobiae bacterium]|nr:biopolymer transporter ExbD [Verrucomicrobiae bacterium]